MSPLHAPMSSMPSPDASMTPRSTPRPASRTPHAGLGRRLLTLALCVAAASCGSDGGGDGGTGQEGIVINEICAKAIADASFNPTGSDWIELYNGSNATVDLSGAALIDSKSKPFADALPLPAGTKIPANGYLIVYFNHDGVGVPNIAKGLGASEALTLYGADGGLLDQVDWKDGDAPEGSSWGRSPDGGSLTRTFDKPTPSAPNP